MSYILHTCTHYVFHHIKPSNHHSQNMMNANVNSWGLASMSTFEFPARNCCDWSCLESCWKRFRRDCCFDGWIRIFVTSLLPQQFLLNEISLMFLFRDSWDLGESSSSMTIVSQFSCNTNLVLVIWHCKGSSWSPKRCLQKPAHGPKMARMAWGPKLPVGNIDCLEWKTETKSEFQKLPDIVWHTWIVLRFEGPTQTITDLHMAPPHTTEGAGDDGVVFEEVTGPVRVETLQEFVNA